VLIGCYNVIITYTMNINVYALCGCNGSYLHSWSDCVCSIHDEIIAAIIAETVAAMVKTEL